MLQAVGAKTIYFHVLAIHHTFYHAKWSSCQQKLRGSSCPAKESLIGRCDNYQTALWVCSLAFSKGLPSSGLLWRKCFHWFPALSQQKSRRRVRKRQWLLALPHGVYRRTILLSCHSKLYGFFPLSLVDRWGPSTPPVVLPLGIWQFSRSLSLSWMANRSKQRSKSTLSVDIKCTWHATSYGPNPNPW